MKKNLLIFAFVAFYIVVFDFTASSVRADGTAYNLNAGEAVDLKWDSKNILDCRAANDYYTNMWGSNNIASSYTAWSLAPKNFGSIKFAANVFNTPGAYKFRFNCRDDEDATRYSEDETLKVYPLIPTSPTDSCKADGSARDFSWTAASGAINYRVQVTKPTNETCPSGWSTINSTTCEDDTGVGVTTASYPTISGTSYSWRVASKTGLLISGNIANGVYNSVKYADGGSFSCTAAPSVILKFI